MSEAQISAETHPRALASDSDLVVAYFDDPIEPVVPVALPVDLEPNVDEDPPFK